VLTFLLAILVAAPRFNVTTLQVEGDIFAVVATDLDGDGKKDLLAAYTTGLPPYQKRFLAIFWNRGASFAPKPDLVLPVSDDDACAFDVGDVDGEPGDELLIVTPKGVSAQSFRGRTAGELRPLVEQVTLFHQPIPGELPRTHLAQDFSGQRALLVPALGQLWIWKRTASGYARAAVLEVDIESGSSGGRRNRTRDAIPSIRLSYTFPELHLADTDGDGLVDILAVQEDRLAIYRQGPGFTFKALPDFTRDFAIRTAQDHNERQASASMLVADLDGDGVADLLVRKQVSQGITSALTESRLYLGLKGGGYAKAPDQVLKSEGIGFIGEQLIDLTGDGHPDLLVPSMSFGVLALVRVLTTQTVKVDFQVLPFLPDKRRFAEQPLAERTLKFGVSLSGDSDFRAVDFTGDYDGDKRPDLVFGTDDKELSFYRARSGVLSDEVAETVPVRAVGSVQPVDLDGKGRSDLILFSPSTKGSKGEIVVLINVGPW